MDVLSGEAEPDDEHLDQTSQGIIVTDLKGVIQSVNGPFTEVTGYTSEEAIGKTPSISKSGKQNAAFYANLWATLKETGTWQGDIWNRRKNGETYLEWLTINGIRNEAGEIKFFAAMFSDITRYR